ncbi:MAG: hypothetical protein A2Y25_09505 [Candidatus Melainabacteria bacterium GWF2_37_15]|nr:MAG: hypothetical protein A2Y25_09505 [Candidatus Melainabacteria bacterium GWF2_37_15]
MKRPKGLKGHCKKCGSCCRNITFAIKKDYIKTEEDFERLKKFDRKYNHFFISGQDEDGVLLFTCKSLTDDNLCRDYFFRSLYCRLYPKIQMKHLKTGGELLDGCGYSFFI